MADLFLHGLGETAEDWAAVLRQLDTGGRPLCPSLPALGGGGASSFEALYQGLCRLCAGEPGPHRLCGLSLGGLLALRYGAEHPENTAALVLIGTPAPIPRTLLRLQDLLFSLMPERAFAAAGFSKHETRLLCRSMAALRPEGWAEKAACPALVLRGERDRANRRAARLLARRLPQGELLVIPGAGHQVTRDAPAPLGEALTDFYRRLSSGPPPEGGRHSD